MSENAGKELIIKEATDAFRGGYNCCQSVVCAYSEKFHFDKKVALEISCGFGGGMGRLQETCGAVTGAYMVLGIHNCRLYKEIKDQKDKTYAMVRSFDRKFKQHHGSTNCKALLGCDWSTKEGKQFAIDNNLHENICGKLVSHAIEILEDLIH